jgi:hypothetical protein
MGPVPAVPAGRGEGRVAPQGGAEGKRAFGFWPKLAKKFHKEHPGLSVTSDQLRVYWHGCVKDGCGNQLRA